jgi:hypothetical protein
MLKPPTLALPTAPGALLGHRKNGAPIRLIAGGSQPAGEPAPAPAAPATGDPATPPPAAPPTPPPATGAGDVDWKAEAEKWKVLARKHEDRAKGNATNSENLAKVAAALGIEVGDKPDPAKLAEQVKQAQADHENARSEAAAARIELQVHRTAVRLGAHADRLLDSRSFCDAIDALDPKDPSELPALIEAKIGDALKKDPSLRAGQAPARSGGEMPPPNNGQPRPTSLRAAIGAHYGAQRS